MNTVCLGILLISFVHNFSGSSATVCYECLPCNNFNPSTGKQVNCQGSCVKSKTDEIVSRTCSKVDLITKCERQGDLEVCACSSDQCNGSSDGRTALLGLLLSFICYLLV